MVRFDSPAPRPVIHADPFLLNVPPPQKVAFSPDLILVGAGTAGAVLARRLVLSTDARVLLLESGPSYPWWFLAAPLAGLRLRRFWSHPYATVPQAGLGGRSIPIPMGRVVGGTSSVNAMVAAPGSLDEFDEWQALGCTGWSSLDVAQARARALGNLPGCSLPVSPPRHQSAFTAAFLQACEEEGLRRVSPLAGDASETCGPFALFQSGGNRRSSAHCLDSVSDHPRLRVATGCEVRRLLLTGDRATGVEWTQGGQPRTTHSSAGVVVCAGSLMTPALLQRSGIGPARLLEECGIPVRILPYGQRCPGGGASKPPGPWGTRSVDRGQLDHATHSPGPHGRNRPPHCRAGG